ncbi:MAG: NAD(P)H-binding protein, partial [Alphaproteobacteria bacterium]|nr:NAD(P)H-binding protein [Alphaproteobacteria bacterium]
MKLGITGGTGFVGRATIAKALAAGHGVRALTRRPQSAQNGVEWIAGSLDNLASLADLCAGTDAIIHIAGVVNAPDKAGFTAGNITGTQVMIAAAQVVGVKRFIHVSSIAATKPDCSDYCWSKAQGEGAVMASSLDWTVVRPPGVYGPDDTEMFDLYRLAQRGIALVPGQGRIALVHVDDLARLLVMCAEAPETIGQIYEPDDGRDDWTHTGYVRAIGLASGKTVRVLALPRAALMLGADLDRLMRGADAKLTPDRARYLAQPDWRVDPAKRPPATLWQPEIDTIQGIAQTRAA